MLQMFVLRIWACNAKKHDKKSKISVGYVSNNPTSWEIRCHVVLITALSELNSKRLLILSHIGHGKDSIRAGLLLYIWKDHSVSEIWSAGLRLSSSWSQLYQWLLVNNEFSTDTSYPFVPSRFCSSTIYRISWSSTLPFLGFSHLLPARGSSCIDELMIWYYRLYKASYHCDIADP